jgi:hypothetical protein
MKSKSQILKEIDIHEKNMVRQSIHAEKMKGDGHEHSREIAITLLRGLIAGKKQVLNGATVSELKKCDTCINSYKSDDTCANCRWNTGFKDKYKHFNEA